MVTKKTTTKKTTTKKETKKPNVKYTFTEEKRPCYGGALYAEAIKQTDILQGLTAGVMTGLATLTKQVELLTVMIEQMINKEDDTISIKVKK